MKKFIILVPIAAVFISFAVLYTSNLARNNPQDAGENQLFPQELQEDTLEVDPQYFKNIPDLTFETEEITVSFKFSQIINVINERHNTDSDNSADLGYLAELANAKKTILVTSSIDRFAYVFTTLLHDCNPGDGSKTQEEKIDILKQSFAKYHKKEEEYIKVKNFSVLKTPPLEELPKYYCYNDTMVNKKNGRKVEYYHITEYGFTCGPTCGQGGDKFLLPDGTSFFKAMRWIS